MPATICLMIAIMTKKSMMRQQKGTISIQFSGQIVRHLHWIVRTVNSLFAMDFCLSFSKLLVQSLFDSDGIGVVFTLFHRTVFTLAVEYQYPIVFTHVFSALLRWTRMYDLLLKFRRSVRRMLRPIQSRAVTLCKSDKFEIFPIRSHILLYLPFLAAMWAAW